MYSYEVQKLQGKWLRPQFEVANQVSHPQEEQAKLEIVTIYQFPAVNLTLLLLAFVSSWVSCQCIGVASSSTSIIFDHPTFRMGMKFTSLQLGVISHAVVVAKSGWWWCCRRPTWSNAVICCDLQRLLFTNIAWISSVLKGGCILRLGFDFKADLALAINFAIFGVRSLGMRMELPKNSQSGTPSHITWRWRGIWNLVISSFDDDDFDYEQRRRNMIKLYIFDNLQQIDRLGVFNLTTLLALVGTVSLSPI